MALNATYIVSPSHVLIMVRVELEVVSATSTIMDL